MKKLLTLALLASLPFFIHSMEPVKTRKIAAGIPKFVVSATSPDGTKIAGVSSTGNISVWDARTKQAINSKITHKLNVVALAFVANGLKLRVTTSTGDEVYDIQLMPKMKGSMPTFSVSTMSADGGKIAGVSSTGNISVWDANSGLVINPSIVKDKTDVTQLAFDPEGSTLLVNTSTGWEGYALHPDPVLVIPHIKRRPEVASVASSSATAIPGGIVLRPVGAGPAVTTTTSQPRALLAVASQAAASQGVALQAKPSPFVLTVKSMDGTKMAGISSTGTISVWDTQTGALINPSVAGDIKNPERLEFGFSQDSILVRTPRGLEAYSIYATPKATPQIQRRAVGIPQFVKSALSPDGTKVVGVTSGNVSVWDSASGAIIDSSVVTTSSDVQSLAFTPDGTSVSVTTLNGTEVYGLMDPTVLQTIRSNPVLQKTDGTQDRTKIVYKNLSPDRTKLIILEEGGNVSMWNALTGAVIHRSVGVFSTIQSVKFSPDGNRFTVSLGKI